MERHTASLPITKNLKLRLEKCGIESINELKNLKPTDLIKTHGFTKDEVADLLSLVNIQAKTVICPQTALDIFNAYKQYNGYISTSSNQLDRILNGGIQFGKVTEICGSAGIGKTQFCIQLCINVQLCVENSKAIYIDTEGSFMTNRVFEIATESIKQAQDCPSALDAKKLMSNIFLFRCTENIQLMSIINNLNFFLNEQKTVKLIVLDSLAYLFRYTDIKDSSSMTCRTTILNTLQEAIAQLTIEHKVAFVLTNQMTTKFQPQQQQQQQQQSNLVPALGETWAHFPNLRLLLYWKNGTRFASVCKSSCIPENHAMYQIKEGGIRDVVNNPTIEPDENEELDENQKNTKKYRYN
jgi:RAD51-like protein 2